MLIFKREYFFAAILLFLVEIIIALYIRDQIIRPYLGDVLVVIFLYCFLRSFVNISVKAAGFLVLVFAYFIEILQYINILSFLGLQDNTFAQIVLGSHFEWTDMLAYTFGLLLIFTLENFRRKGNKKTENFA